MELAQRQEDREAARGTEIDGASTTVAWVSGSDGLDLSPGGYGGGYGANNYLSRAAPAPTLGGRVSSAAGNLFQTFGAAMGFDSGLNDALDEDNSLSKRVAGGLGAYTGAVGVAQGVSGVAAATGLLPSNTFFGGLAGASYGGDIALGSTWTGAECVGAGAAGGAVATGAGVLGAGLSGFALGSYGDEHMAQLGLLGKGVEVSDWASQITYDAVNGAENWVEGSGGLFDDAAEEGSFRDYAGDFAGINAGLFAGIGTTVAGGELAALSAAHGIASDVAAEGQALYHGAANVVGSLENNGMLPAARDTIGAIFGCY